MQQDEHKKERRITTTLPTKYNEITDISALLLYSRHAIL